VFFVRVIAVMSLLCLQNCAQNMDLGADGLDNRGGQMASVRQYRHLAKAAHNYAAPDYDGLIPYRSAEERARPVLTKKVISSGPGDKRESENSNAEMLPEPVRASMGAPSLEDALPPPTNSKFLEQLSDQDSENQTLKRKTLICRGC